MTERILCMNKKVLPFFILLLVCLTVGCDQKSSSMALTPEQRAVARWDALIAGNWKDAYEFESPGYRQAKTVDDLRQSYGGLIDWKSIEVLEVSMESEKVAVVRLLLKSMIYDPGFGGEGMLIPTEFKERWLFKDGQWWYVRD